MLYYDLLMALKENFKIKRLQDYTSSSKNVCFLRHDIDWASEIPMTMAMAQIEAKHGISSTFYVLNTSDYYRKGNFVEMCTELQNMGHEVGLHNNILTKSIKTKVLPHVILESELTFLRNQEINIKGTSAHGDPLCRRLNYMNYEIFKQCVPSYRKKRESLRGIPLHSLDLNDYGLYEAYFLPRDFYITASWGMWRSIAHGDELHPLYKNGNAKRQILSNEAKKYAPVINNIIEYVSMLGSQQKTIQILIHDKPRLTI